MHTRRKWRPKRSANINPQKRVGYFELPAELKVVLRSHLPFADNASLLLVSKALAKEGWSLVTNIEVMDEVRLFNPAPAFIDIPKALLSSLRSLHIGVAIEPTLTEVLVGISALTSLRRLVLGGSPDSPPLGPCPLPPLLEHLEVAIVERTAGLLCDHLFDALQELKDLRTLHWEPRLSYNDIDFLRGFTKLERLRLPTVKHLPVWPAPLDFLRSLPSAVFIPEHNFQLGVYNSTFIFAEGSQLDPTPFFDLGLRPDPLATCQDITRGGLNALGYVKSGRVDLLGVKDDVVQLLAGLEGTQPFLDRIFAPLVDQLLQNAPKSTITGDVDPSARPRIAGELLTVQAPEKGGNRSPVPALAFAPANVASELLQNLDQLYIAPDHTFGSSPLYFFAVSGQMEADFADLGFPPDNSPSRLRALLDMCGALHDSCQVVPVVNTALDPEFVFTKFLEAPQFLDEHYIEVFRVLGEYISGELAVATVGALTAPGKEQLLRHLLVRLSRKATDSVVRNAYSAHGILAPHTKNIVATAIYAGAVKFINFLHHNGHGEFPDIHNITFTNRQVWLHAAMFNPVEVSKDLVNALYHSMAGCPRCQNLHNVPDDDLKFPAHYWVTSLFGKQEVAVERRCLLLTANWAPVNTAKTTIFQLLKQLRSRPSTPQ